MRIIRNKLEKVQPHIVHYKHILLANLQTLVWYDESSSLGTIVPEAPLRRSSGIGRLKFGCDRLIVCGANAGSGKRSFQSVRSQAGAWERVQRVQRQSHPAGATHGGLRVEGCEKHKDHCKAQLETQRRGNKIENHRKHVTHGS